MSLPFAMVLITSEELSLYMFRKVSRSISVRVVLLFDGGDQSFWGRSDIGSMLIDRTFWGGRAMNCMLIGSCSRQYTSCEIVAQ